jgi:hypothetical protein
MNPDTPKTEKEIENLKKVGFSQKKIDELIVLLAPDIEEDIFNRLIDNSSDEVLNGFKDKLATVSTKENYQAIFAEIAQIVLGDKWKDELDTIWAITLKEVADQTLKFRDTYHKYMSGDPDTVKKIKELENSKEVIDQIEQMEKDGFDFQAEVAK